ncbi:hypothetical protein ACFLZB_01880 [Nanoarchaeota archaeon]
MKNDLIKTSVIFLAATLLISFASFFLYSWQPEAPFDLTTGAAVAAAPAGAIAGADNITEQWNKTYNGGAIDEAQAVATDTSNNVIVTGSSNLGTTAYFTIKYDSNGNHLWNKTYDSAGGDTAYGVATDSSNNVIVTGESYLAGDYDRFTIKYDSSGNHLWNKTYDGGVGSDSAYGVAIDSLDNIIVAGSEYVGVGDYDFLTIKYDENGTALWNKTYNGSNNDQIRAVTTDFSNNVIVTGNSNLGGDNDYFTIKYDSNGNHLWNKTYDGGAADVAYGVAADSSNNVIVTGYSNLGGNTDYFTIKYDSNGNHLWNKTIDFTSLGEQAKAVATDSFDNIIVTGYSYISGNYYYYTIKYDEDGNELWNSTFGPGISPSQARGVAIDSTNNILLTGNINNDYHTVKYLVPPPQICSGFIGNQSNLNCTVIEGDCSYIQSTFNYTKIMGIYSCNNSHVELANESSFDYSLCCAPTTAGVTLGTNDTGDSSSSNFLNLYQTTNSHVEIPNGAFIHYNNGSNLTLSSTEYYTVNASISTDTGSITCSYYEDYYGNCSLPTETCLLTVPMNLTDNTTNMHAASCNASHAYDTSICCDLSTTELTVYVDGTESDNFSKTALPYLVDVVSTPDTKIGIFEENANVIFFPLKLSGSLTRSLTIGETDSNGNITFVVAPTRYNSDNYSIYVAKLDNSYNIVDQLNLSVISYSAIPQEKKSFSDQDIADDTKIGVNSMIYVVNSLYIWANSPPQANIFNFTVYENGTYTLSSSTTDDKFQTGAVNLINVTLKNSTDQIISGYVEPKELEGLLMINPIYKSPYTGSKNHTLFNRYTPTSQEFFLTPTSYSPASSQVELLIYNSTYDAVANITMSINENLEPRSGVSYENDDLKQAISNAYFVIQNLYYALN